MADKRAERIAELIKPLRVKPGSKVNLGKDFDPAYKAGVLKKKDGVGLLQTGIAMLADYQINALVAYLLSLKDQR